MSRGAAGMSKTASGRGMICREGLAAETPLDRYRRRVAIHGLFIGEGADRSCQHAEQRREREDVTRLGAFLRHREVGKLVDERNGRGLPAEVDQCPA